MAGPISRQQGGGVGALFVLVCEEFFARLSEELDCVLAFALSVDLSSTRA